MLYDELYHYGTPHVGSMPHSGRYPWGSGDSPYQRGEMSLREFKKMMKGLGYANDTDIARAAGLSTGEFRDRIGVEKEQQLAADRSRVQRMRDHGWSVSEISKRTGIPGTTVRSYLEPVETKRKDSIKAVSDVVRERTDKYKYVDVGSGSSLYLGISDQKLSKAVSKLREDGYQIIYPKVEQAGNPGKYTHLKVLIPPGMSKHEAYKHIESHFDDVKMITDYKFNDDGITGRGILPPKSLDSSRIQIRYAEEGGKEKDGVVELRRGVEDISLGKSQYAQVRIAVDGTHYIKGMAVYGTNMPKGVDVVFNTNKHKGTPMISQDGKCVLKEMKRTKDGSIDMQNPFGATIKELSAGGQRIYTDKNGNEQQSVINKVKDEGDWETWKNTVSAQFLSKQNLPLIKKQLEFTYQNKVAEYKEICDIQNPTLKRQLLLSFAEDCDSSAVKLKAAALPRQSFKVILPVKSLKNNEIYAPDYKDGEEVALVRYPHSGTFEIPLLKVNNSNREAKSMMRGARDAVGINSAVADRMSGADFDGDTVMVIPTSHTKVKSTPYLRGLIDFDPKEAYPGYEGMPKMKDKTKQKEMGMVTNLIADMTLKGATDEELERAVKHSMVVIDAQKHKLNYKLSEQVNGIDALKRKYQVKSGGKYGGASTLITKAKSEIRVDEKKMHPKIDPNTGELIYKTTDRGYTDKDGKFHKYKEKSTHMAEVKDAFDLVSPSANPKEIAYANYANNLKSLANTARKTYISTPPMVANTPAKKTYSVEVKSLDSKLNDALRNAPLERQAQLLARQNINKQKRLNPDLSTEDLKKLRTQSISAARSKVGAGKKAIDISDKEWEAIQAGAISDSKLKKIFANTDEDKLKERAMPRTNGISMSPAKIAIARGLYSNGYTQAQIADMLGVSISTISKALK